MQEFLQWIRQLIELALSAESKMGIGGVSSLFSVLMWIAVPCIILGIVYFSERGGDN